jgi:hypothetical protein
VTGDPREDWAALLDPGERLLWVGMPAGGLRLTPKGIGTSVFGLFFFGFSVFWTLGAASPLLVGFSGEMPGGFGWFFILFPLFGLPFVAIGAYMLFGHVLHDAWRRRRTRYALTDRRAIITSWAGRRSLKSFPIGPGTLIDYQPGPEASLFFATETSVDSDGDRTSERIGFEHIADGEAAYAAVRRIQTGTA